MSLKKIFLKNHILIIVLAGLSIRLFFYFFGAKVYYGKPDFFLSGDTASWVKSIINLIEHGTYSVNLQKDTGIFFRPPGYSFFMGIFYLLSGKDIDLTYKIIIWVQILLDAVSIYLIYKIVNKVFANVKWAVIAALLYTFYPFIIVWTPIIYAESVSVFFLIAGCWFFVNDKMKHHYLLSGLFIGIATLTRLQIIFLFPAVCLAMLFHYRNDFKIFIRFALPFTIAFMLSYGLWPARNYFLHNTVMFSQDLSAIESWDKDIMGFRDYIYSVKTDWDPQMTQIMKGEKVQWPAASYIVPEDTVLLNEAAQLCHECGLGFSSFMKNSGLRKGNLPRDSSCSVQIAALFKTLRQNQIEHNYVNVNLWVPLGNLKKALFKSGLYNPTNKIVNLVSTLLFGYRTVLLIIGLLGMLLYYFVHKRSSVFLNIIFLYFLFSYLSLSFIYRNMEMRFLIQADLLMLIPAAYVFTYVIEKYFIRKNKTEPAD